MSITKLNSLAIPAGTVEPADISYPLTNFSSTGIDDNADATAITINSSEHVGIRSLNPSGQLECSTGTGTAFFTRSAGDNGTTSSCLAVSTGPSTTIIGATNPLTFNVGSTGTAANAQTERMRIDTSGNVGIGATSPAHELHIAGTEPNIRLESGGTPSALYGLEITNGSTVDGYFRSRGATGETQIGSGRSSGWGGHLTFYTDTSERMRIDSAGRVGIGVTSMVNPLQIAVTPNSNSKTSGSAFDGAALRLDGNINGADKEVAILGGQNDNLSAGIGFARQNSTDWGTQIRFYTHGPAVTTTDELTERMRIDSSGYVTKPNTPVFSYGAYTTYDVTGTGTQIVSTSTVWNNSSYVHLNYNNGSHFNPSNGRFTAPVAGIYRFDYRCGLADHSSGYFWWYIYKNSTAIAYWQSTQGMSSGSDDVALASMHIYVNLAANDYIEVKWANNYVSGTVYYPHFSGALVA